MTSSIPSEPASHIIDMRYPRQLRGLLTSRSRKSLSNTFVDQARPRAQQVAHAAGAPDPHVEVGVK